LGDGWVSVQPEVLMGQSFTSVFKQVLVQFQRSSFNSFGGFRRQNSLPQNDLEMETTGIEPATSWLQTRRSPN
jgi:hypothetical protein